MTDAFVHEAGGSSLPGVSLASRNLGGTDPGVEMCRLSGVTFHNDVTAQFVLSARGHGIPVCAMDMYKEVELLFPSYLQLRKLSR